MKKVVAIRIIKSLIIFAVIIYQFRTYGTKYSRIDQVKFVEDSLSKI